MSNIVDLALLEVGIKRHYGASGLDLWQLQEFEARYKQAFESGTTTIAVCRNSHHHVVTSPEAIYQVWLECQEVAEVLTVPNALWEQLKPQIKNVIEVAVVS